MRTTFEEQEQKRVADKIVAEYLSFRNALMKDHQKVLKLLYATEAHLEELRVGTSIALSKVFNLKEGDTVSISPDGKLKIIYKET